MTKHDTRTDALLDDLLQGCESPEEILGDQGLLKGLTKWLVERALAAELTTHLGYAPHRLLATFTRKSTIRNDSV